jgi:uncharacterized protein
MPGGWSKRYEFAKLVDTHTELVQDIPVAELTGLPEGVSAGSGPLHAHARFYREQGWPLATLNLRGEVGLVCQRCLKPMRQAVAADTRVVLLASEAEAERAPPEEETFLAADGLVSLGELVREELLLALPIVPRHENEAECSLGTAAEAGETAETQRPFADLRAMMKRT